MFTCYVLSQLKHKLSFYNELCWGQLTHFILVLNKVVGSGNQFRTKSFRYDWH